MTDLDDENQKDLKKEINDSIINLKKRIGKGDDDEE